MTFIFCVSPKTLLGIISSLAFSPIHPIYAAGSFTPTIGNVALFDETAGETPVMIVGNDTCPRAGVMQVRVVGFRLFLHSHPYQTVALQSCQAPHSLRIVPQAKRDLLLGFEERRGNTLVCIRSDSGRDFAPRGNRQPKNVLNGTNKSKITVRR
jgi:hypothetical protein